MSDIDINLRVKVNRTPRVMQLEGLFDVPEASHREMRMKLKFPIDERDWKIGCIVGPSGCGKSTVMNEVFEGSIVDEYEWSPNNSLVDDFPKGMTVRDITTALSQVGFSSPPSWLKPYRVLSNGEKFRANMARCLVDESPLTVVDEFTSVVDRTVAKIGSAAISKAIRRSEKQFVAVSCHDDIVDWLQPDWVLRPAEKSFAWRSLQPRPAIELTIQRVPTSFWSLFAHHHYLTSSLMKSAWCFAAFYEGKPVAFTAWAPFFGRTASGRKARVAHRSVCLPDYQGVGIGSRLTNAIASMWAGLGYDVFAVTAHPALMQSRMRSPEWRVNRHGFVQPDRKLKKSTRRKTMGSKFIGEKMPRAEALKLLG